MSKHICGLECERYCCDIEGHDMDDGICLHCGYEHEYSEDEYKDIEIDAMIDAWKETKHE